jgi:RIO kinase 1
VTTNDRALDEYDEYETRFDPMRSDRQARRRRRPQVRHTPKKSERQVVNDLADQMIGLEGGFETTYRPSKHEAGWLLQSLKEFYDQHLISDVLALVKGGKEASVYRCAATPSTGLEQLAAKVYRPRMFRSLSNDAVYREGRGILDADGHDVQGGLHAERIMRAVGKKTAFGEQVSHTSWLMHEYTALKTLHAAGAAVPQPVAVHDNAILMSYLGDERLAAPALSQVDLYEDEVEPLFAEVLRNVHLMLQNGMVHGDLSAYNILYWEGAITVIDLPQVVNIHSNRNASAMLKRDIQRVCDYFAGYGLDCDAQAVAYDLWRQYLAPDPYLKAADESRFLADIENEEE